MNILLLEKIHSIAAKKLRGLGWNVKTKGSAMTPAELKKVLRNVSALGIRSKTVIDSEILDSAPKLQAIGLFCIGHDHVDLDEASHRGIAVFNAPHSSARSVCELVIGHIIALMRGTHTANQKMHSGVWHKTAEHSFEVRGKTLGIIGYGHIGSQVSALAESLGMEIIFYDLRDVLAFGTARRCRSLRELLIEADIVTLHVPDTSATRNLIGANELKIMKKGSWLINTSRGKVVKLPELKLALESGRLRGAAIDVFPSEPGSNKIKWETPLIGVPNVILTPHIAGNTREAQKEIGENASEKLIKFLSIGTTTGSLNLPQLELPQPEKRHRLIHVHRNVPGVISEIGATLKRHKINIAGQRLETTKELGYLVTDIDHAIPSALIKEITNSPNTIRVRVLS